MALYDAYKAGWHACLDGVDGRYWFHIPGDCAGQAGYRAAWQMGWLDAFEREDDADEPLPEDWLSLNDLVS